MTDWADQKIASPYDDTPDADVASEDELNLVVNTGQVNHQVPLTRFNPHLPYANPPMQFDPNDRVLVATIRKAIGAGWEGWRNRVNDATTVGMEAEQLAKEMKKYNADVKGLVFDNDFARFAGYDIVELAKELSNGKDVITCLRERL